MKLGCSLQQKRNITVERIINSNHDHIDRIERRVNYTNSFLEYYRMRTRHRLRIVRENLTLTTVIIDGAKHHGHARF